MYFWGFTVLSVLGSLLSLSSENWFVVWVGMEISTLSFLAIMASGQGFLVLTSSWKYLVFQSVGSLLIFLPLVFPFSGGTVLALMSAVGLGIKLGFLPFHGWLLHVTEVDMAVLFLLCSVQKVAPLVLMANLQVITWVWFQAVIIISTVWSSMVSVEKMSVKKIIIFSSILMTGWMSCSLMGWGVVVVFFIIYVLHLLFFTLSVMESPFHGTISSLYTSSCTTSLLSSMALGAMVGLPPFGVFLMKLELLSFLLGENSLLMALALLLSSGIMLVGYIKFLIPFILSSKKMQPSNPILCLLIPFLFLIPMIVMY